MFIFLQQWSYREQEQELQHRAPALLEVVEALTVGPRRERSKTRTKEETLPARMNAIGSLLHCRNRLVNSHQTITGLQLKRGGVSKQAVQRLHARGITVSYETIISRQLSLGRDYDENVKEWSTEMTSNREKEEEISANINFLQVERESGVADQACVQKLKEQLKHQQSSRHPGFKLITDNVDLRITPRQSTMCHGAKDLHYCNSMAVKNKVEALLC